MSYFGVDLHSNDDRTRAGNDCTFRINLPYSDDHACQMDSP